MSRSSPPRRQSVISNCSSAVATAAAAAAWTWRQNGAAAAPVLRRAGAAATLSFLLAGAAAAQVLYVPVPSTGAFGQSPQVRLSFANPSGADRRCGTVFIPAGHDGSAPGRPRQTTVPAGGTAFFDGTALISGAGLLQLSGAPQVFAGAELSLQLPGGAAELALPVLSGANVVAAHNLAVVQGLRRGDDGALSNLELVNFGQQLAQCSVSLVAADGTGVGAATVTVPPVSMRSFPDVLKGAGAVANVAADVAAHVTCDQGFYPYAVVYTPNPAALRLVGPAPALGAGIGGSGNNGGGGPPPSQGPPAQPIAITRGGVFFAPGFGNSALDVPVPLTLNAAYSVATMEFDMLVGPFTPHYTTILALVRTGSRTTRTLYFGFDIRGNVGKTFIDLGVPVLEPAIKAGFPWAVGVQYHIKLTYDVVQKQITLDVFSGGTQVDHVQGGNFNWDLSDNGQGVRLAFGLPGVADGAYFPPLGWVFSNLSASFR
jgi:hypothetical protein